MDSLQNFVLIIEDNFDISFFLSEFLKIRNFKSVHATTLRAVKEINEDICPSIIFVDNGLPDGFGFDLIPVLRKKYPDAKIIAMTAEDISSGRQKAIENGADHFLEKPFSFNAILKFLG